MITEERKFCIYCKRPSAVIPCSECQTILIDYDPSKHWSYKDLPRYADLLFNKEFYIVTNVIIRSADPNGMTFNEIHRYLATRYTTFRLSQILTSLMYLGYCYQPIPKRYKFKLKLTETNSLR